MQQIANVVQELRSITGALLPPHADPFGRRPRRVYELPSGRQEWTLSIDPTDYPNWIEAEVWQPTTRAVNGDQSNRPTRIGVDALAWYVSFHHDGPNWGIYIPISSLAYVETCVLKKMRTSREEKWKLALQLLLAHECMHFIVDYQCAQWELLLQAPCRAALHERIKNEQNYYLAVEEQVANGYMLHRILSHCSPPAKKAIQDFVKTQPPGYRDALELTDESAFLRALADVIKCYVGLHSLERGLNITSSSYEIVRDFSPAKVSEGYSCPVHVFDDDRIGLPESAFSLIASIPSIVETDDFSRRFERLENSLQSRWRRLKSQLPDGIPRSARFEKIRSVDGSVFSMRLNDNFRVHVRQTNGRWEAFAVGSHKEMRHG